MTNAFMELTVRERQFATFEPSAGRYWLWNSAGGDIVIVSCEEGGISGGVGVVAG